MVNASSGINGRFVNRGLGLSIIPKLDYGSPFLEHTTLLN